MRSRQSRSSRKGPYKKNLSLNRLLSRQPKSLRKHPYYDLMISHYLASDKLQSLRMNRRCYRLLDQGIITAENLGNLYRSYRVPQDPFFPLFIRIKKDYLSERLKKKEAKEQYILARMKMLPPHKRRELRFLAEWEESLSAGKSRQIWEKMLYPGSKKRAREILNFSETQWQVYIDGFLKTLGQKYPAMAKKQDILSACLFLHIIPESELCGLPSKEKINKAYRQLSRVYHPDSGGESPLFIRLQNSRDLLLHKVHP